MISLAPKLDAAFAASASTILIIENDAEDTFWALFAASGLKDGGDFLPRSKGISGKAYSDQRLYRFARLKRKAKLPTPLALAELSRKAFVPHADERIRAGIAPALFISMILSAKWLFDRALVRLDGL